MKVFALVLLALLGVSNALPSQQATKNQRFIGDIIVGIIEDITQQIKDNGFDPWIQDGGDFAIGLPVPTIFDLKAHLEDVSVTGVSNIIVNRMNFGLLTNRLDMDISLPRIAISVGDAGFDATILGSHFDFSANANLVIVQPRIAGRIQFNVGIISGIFVRNVDLAFNMNSMQFNGQVRALGIDITNDLRHLINVMIPQRLNELENDINQLVNIVALELINTILDDFL